MLSLENTASRMSHLARQEIYFDRQFGLDETLAGHRARDDRRRAARGARSVHERLAGGDGARQRERLADSARDGWISDSVSDLRSSHDSRATPTRRWARIWSDQRRYETWLLVETAAAEAMADAGIVPADAARDIRERGALRHRAHRRNRTDHAARRDRVHDRGRREGRAVGALAALRHDLVGRHRHRAGAADARGLRPHPQGPRRAGGRGPRARRSSIGARR